MNSKPEVPVFFATDDNYAPFLAVTFKSILDNASKDFSYKFYVLTTNLSSSYEKRIKEFESEDVKIEFIFLKETIEKIKAKFHLRDYYSIETYYRFFIANMFPQYDKVLYCDCDVIVLGDIAELYNHNIDNYLVGACPEEVMAEVKVFGDYVEQALDVECEKYFNAGVMLMNLDGFRKENIEEKFFDMLQKYTFRVTQDEDYLNVLCKGKVKLFHLGWNKTAFKNEKFNDKDLKLIHYKIHWKPWHYDGVLYENHFWDYAKQTSFYEEILDKKLSYTDEEKRRDAIAYERLKQMAIDDAKDPNNYKNLVCK
ncbi:MAG: glycosyltransferase family 8 protein [Treponema sp.]|nr:glycosyltransferase family 8 protein [Treponema sp.]MBQ5877634.1 glycosyltransferase family 8 protein [Treponema sp.]